MAVEALALLNDDSTEVASVAVLDDGTQKWPGSFVAHVTALGSPDTLVVPIAAAMADATANPTVIAESAYLMGFNGTTWDRLKSTTANGLDVDVTRVGGTVTVDNVGTFAVQVDGDALTALQKIDDPVFVDDAAFTPGTSSVMVGGFLFDDTAPDSVDEGDVGAARMSSNRNQYIQIRDGAGNERGANVDAANELQVGGTDLANAASDISSMMSDLSNLGAATAVNDSAYTFASRRAFAIAGHYDDTSTDTIDEGDSGTVRVSGNRNLYFQLRDGGGSERGVNVNASNQLEVSVENTPTVTANAGTGTFTVDGSGVTQPVSGTVTVAGQTAHDSAVTGNPVRIGGKANANEPAAVADGDACDLWVDPLGRVVTVDGHPTQTGPVTVNKTAAAISDVIATPGAGVSLYIRRVWLSNNSATKVKCTLSDGATGKAAGTLAADGGGVMMDFGGAGWKLTANQALRATLDGASDVEINVLDYYVAA